MAELIDLTLTLGSDRVSTVPGLMGVETSPLQTHETHARSNQKLCLATHIGTHVDAPFHFVVGAATIEEMPLEKYTGPALLLDLRNVARSQEPLQVSELQAAGGSGDAIAGKIVVLFTGWAEAESGGPRFYGHGPYLSTEGASYLAANGANAVAVDFPIDKHPATPQSTIHDFRTPPVAGPEHPPHREPDQPAPAGGPGVRVMGPAAQAQRRRRRRHRSGRSYPLTTGGNEPATGH